jgi:hypothetical protein
MTAAARCGGGRQTHWVRLWLVLAALSWLLLSGSARAYPQFVFLGLGDCDACHHSPTGGGLPTSWGRSAVSPTFGGTTEDAWGHTDLDVPSTSPRVDLGADLRVMALATEDRDGSAGPSVFPMLTELGGAAAWKGWTLYASATARDAGTTRLLASREHWLGYAWLPSVRLRLGRVALPFGIRQPDHTQYVRQDFGFDKWDQSYGLELDLRAGDWALFANGFVGDLSRPAPRQERGTVMTLQRRVAGDSSVGLSLLTSASTARTRVAASAQARIDVGRGVYTLAELAAQYLGARASSSSLTGVASYLRLGWFVRPDLDLYAEGGQRSILHAGDFAKLRAGIGLNWQLLGWLELAPQVQAEGRARLPTRFTALAQLHLVY